MGPEIKQVIHMRANFFKENFTETELIFTQMGIGLLAVFGLERKMASELYTKLTEKLFPEDGVRTF